MIRNWFNRLRARVARNPPDQDGVIPSVKVQLLTRDGCGLCGIALQVLEQERTRTPFLLEILDIDSDPALKSHYDACVPVVVVDGKVRFRGRINVMLLRRLLDRRA